MIAQKNKKIFWHVVALLWAAIAFEVFFLLSIFYFKTAWSGWLFYLCAATGTTVNVGLLVAEILCFLKGKQVAYKSCIIAYFLLILAAVVAYILLSTGFMEIIKDEQLLEDYLARSGVWMSVVFILLQFLQVIILPIPSTVTVVAGSALFGPLLGSIYSLIGIILGSVVAFLIGRYAGYPVVQWLLGKETLDKWLKKVKGKDKLFLSAMFLLPAFPDDVLCFVAGLSSMSIWFFLGVIFVSRVLAIFVTSYSISLIPLNEWWGILVWIIIFAVVIAAVVVIYKRLDKIEAWLDKKFHHSHGVEEKTEKDEFVLEIVDPDGTEVKKAVKKEGDNQDDLPQNQQSEKK